MSWATIRRAMWLAFLGGGVAGVIAWLRNRDASSTAPPTPEWPPLTAVGDDRTGTPPQSTSVRTTVATSDATTVAGDGTAPTSTGGSGTTTSSFVNSLVDAPDARSDDSSGDWVAPLPDGTCPPTHPIKANDNSGIYHVPGGRFYERTNAERCYATAAAAAADGYRAAKA